MVRVAGFLGYMGASRRPPVVLSSRTCLGTSRFSWRGNVSTADYTTASSPSQGRVFLFFLFFIFIFYKNIFSFSKFTRIYAGRPAAGRPAPGRPAAGRQGLICKKICKKFAFLPGPQAARQLGGRCRLAGSSIFSEDGKSSCFICLLV